MPDSKDKIHNVMTNITSVGTIDIRQIIYVIRGRQVMLDNDLLVLFNGQVLELLMDLNQENMI